MGFNTPGAARSAADLEVQDPPKSRPKPAKMDVEKQHVFGIEVEGFGPRFGRVFGRFFVPKMNEICKNIILAKTLKLVIFPRENAYFQEIEHEKNNKNCTKIDEKLHVFLEIDFGSILERFWHGFGRPKSMIFTIFSIKNGSKK